MSSQKRRRPRGRAPAGKTWDESQGCWVAETAEAAAKRRELETGKAPAVDAAIENSQERDFVIRYNADGNVKIQGEFPHLETMNGIIANAKRQKQLIDECHMCIGAHFIHMCTTVKNFKASHESISPKLNDSLARACDRVSTKLCTLCDSELLAAEAQRDFHKSLLVFDSKINTTEEDSVRNMIDSEYVPSFDALFRELQDLVELRQKFFTLHEDFVLTRQFFHSAHRAIKDISGAKIETLSDAEGADGGAAGTSA